VDEDEPMSDVPDSGADSGASDEDLHVSSHRPEPRGFSMRRLLNVASLGVVGIVLLALATHWLPTVLPKSRPTPDSRVSHAQQTLITLRPTPRGTGWKLRGPDWAEDIAFSADGSVGYACGHFPPEPVEFFAVYHVAANGWEMFPSPLEAPAGGGCRVAVSPIDPDDVALITYNALTSRVVRSHDGGGAWRELRLPLSSSYVTDIDWTQLSLFLVAGAFTSTDNAPPLYHLLVSHADGPLAEIAAQRLIGHAMSFDAISIQSSGRTLYAELNSSACGQACAAAVQSDDEGFHWTPLPPTYQDQPLVPVAAQIGSNSLVGWSFSSRTGTLVVLRSDNNGRGWQALPALPRDPTSGGAELFIVPDGSIFAFAFGAANTVYALGAGASSWRTIAALPAGAPLTVQYDNVGHAVALWGESHDASGPVTTAGPLAYYPLSAKG
jgi:hypothetical protein